MPKNRRPRKGPSPSQRYGLPPAPDRPSRPRGKPFKPGVDNPVGYEKRFPKGKSGNPGGVPKDVREFREACQRRLGKALDRMDDVLDHGSEEGIIKAFKELSANGYGRPPQPLEIGGPGGGPMKITYNDVRARVSEAAAKAASAAEEEPQAEDQDDAGDGDDTGDPGVQPDGD